MYSDNGVPTGGHVVNIPVQDSSYISIWLKSSSELIVYACSCAAVPHPPKKCTFSDHLFSYVRWATMKSQRKVNVQSFYSVLTIEPEPEPNSQQQGFFHLPLALPFRALDKTPEYPAVACLLGGGRWVADKMLSSPLGLTIPGNWPHNFPATATAMPVV